VQDALSKNELKYATVSIQRQADSTKVAFTLTDTKGNFEFRGLPAGVEYSILVFYIGYEVHRVPLYAEQDTILDTIKMVATSKALDEFIVAAERPPLIVRNDTMEFDASSFKTLPDALVEDLLAKLPGVGKDENGQLIVNGKKVSKLLVDGKQFFGSDPSIALKNLPADAIDKVQVTSQAEMDKETGNSDAEDDEMVVINLTIKKGMKKGYFGKMYGGGGYAANDLALHEFGGIVNIFRDTFQVSFIGFSNNTNKQAFSFQDLKSVGGMDRSGVNSFSSSGSGRSIGGFGVGGAQNGINKSNGGGINMNHNLERSYLNVQYFYGDNRADLVNTNFIATTYSDSVINTSNNFKADNYFQSHLAKLRWEFTQDTVTKWTFNLQGDFKLNDNQSSGLTLLTSDSLPLNNSNSQNFRNSNDNKVQFNGSHNYKSRNKKWSATNYFGVNRSNISSRNLTNTLVDFFKNNIITGFEQEEQDRHALNVNLGSFVNSYLTYKFTDSFSIGVHNRVRVNSLDQENQTFSNEGNGLTFNNSLSNVLQKKSQNYEVMPYLTWKFWKFTFRGELGWYNLKNDYTFSNLTNITTIEVNKLLPNASLRYGPMSLRYNKEVVLPSDDQLNPLINNTSPQYTIKGNPSLVPSDKHNFTGYVHKYFPKSKTFLYAYSRWSLEHNPVIQSRQFDQGLISDSIVNFGEKTESQISMQITKAFTFTNKNRLNLKLGGWLSNNVSPVLINDVDYKFLSFNMLPNFTIDFNVQDKFTISQQVNYSVRSNETEGQEALRTDAYGTSTAVLLRWPKRFTWRTSFDYKVIESGTSTLPSNDFKLWSAEVFYDVVKDGRLQLNVKAFDLLKENQSVNTWAQGNQVSFNEANILQQYYLVSLIYNLKAFKAKKVEARESNGWWW